MFTFMQKLIAVLTVTASAAALGATTQPAVPHAAAAPPAASHAQATQDISGVWTGKLKVDANTSLTIQFTFTHKPDGSWSAVVNSPDNPAIKDMPASAVSVGADGTVKLEVTPLSGSYAGTAKGGTIEGQWKQPGSSLPLVLTPYQKPQVARGDMDKLAGTWSGPIKTGAGSLTMVTRFKVSDKGELQGTLSVLEQGGAEIPMSDIGYAGGDLTFKIAAVRGEYDGKLANGAITGVWKQPGTPPEGLPVALKKGEVAAPVYTLKLTSEQFAALSTEWTGTLKFTTPQGQEVSLPMTVRFGTNANGEMIGSFDNPVQKVSIPMTEATLAGGKVDLKAGGVNAEFKGDLAGKTMTGQWIQGPLNVPLTLTKTR
jgi:hypothetical protein